MPSKRSFFSETLFKKNLSRFWPLWGGISLVGALVPLYMLLILVSGSASAPDSRDMTEMFYLTVRVLVPVLSFGYAILCAMAVWSYLYTPRHVGLMHALPIDRTGLYLTSCLSGLAMMVIPYAVTGGLICLIAAAWGFFPPIAVTQTVLSVLLMSVLFFGIATVCAHITGHAVALPAFYLIINFLAPVANALCAYLTENFLLGVSGTTGAEDFAIALSPLLKLYVSLNVDRIWDEAAGEYLPHFQGMGTLLIYGAVGLALLALGWVLYRVRHSETAGDVVAHRWLRPVFRYGVALMGALTLGHGLYLLIWAVFFQRGLKAELVPMIAFLALGGVIGYYIASMFLEKSLRVFTKKSLPGALLVCAASAAVCCFIALDPTGMERWVPEAEDVRSVTVYTLGAQAEGGEDDPAMRDKLMDLHRTIVEDREYIRRFPYGRYVNSETSGGAVEDQEFIHMRVSYTLKNGRSVTRVYDALPVTRARTEQDGTYDALINRYLSDPDVLEQRVRLKSGYTLLQVEANFYDYPYDKEQPALTPPESVSFGGENGQRIYEALRRDARAGRMGYTSALFGENDTQSADGEDIISYPLELVLWANCDRSDPWSPDLSVDTDVQRFDVTSAMTETVAVLLELGAFRESDVELWESGTLAW